MWAGGEAGTWDQRAWSPQVVWDYLSGRFLPLVVRWRTLLIIGAHVPLFAGLYLLAYVIRFDGEIPGDQLLLAWRTLPLIVGVKLGVFLVLKSHRGWWRYATFADMIHLAEASTLGAAAVVMISYFAQWSYWIPRSIVLLDWAGTLLLMGILRGGTRLFRERYYPMVQGKRLTPVLLVGANDVSLALIRQLQVQPKLGYRPVGLLDSNLALEGRILGGLPVLGQPDDVQKIVARCGAKVVLVPTPAVPPAEVRSLVSSCHDAGVKIQIVPGFDAILSGRVVVQPRDVDIHDLLARDPIRLDDQSLGRFLGGRVVLVTGAAGSIGSELCRQILRFQPKRLVLLDHSENGLFYVDRELQSHAAGVELVPCVASITDATRVRAILESHRPAVVLHAAAHKHVPMMEANPGEAVKNNVFGTKTLVDEAIRVGIESFVMISTDKAVNPTSVMGVCKRLAEMYVQSRSGTSPTRLVTVRFGNVLGSNGSVVPLFKEQIRRGGPVTITHPEMTRYFMTIPEATQLVLLAGALGKGGEIFVLDMGQPVKIVDLARDLIRLLGMQEEDVEFVFTGLRPGEKLYEELYDDGEERTTTPHPKIFAAKHRSCDPARLRGQMKGLADLVDHSPAALVLALKEIVPEYRPMTPATAPVPLNSLTLPAAPGLPQFCPSGGGNGKDRGESRCA